jgi:hypothetical protein
MFVFRSLVTGFAAACFVLIAMIEPPARVSEPRVDHEARVVLPTSTRPHVREHAPTLIDVAPAIAGSELASLVRLEPGEHVATVDDVAVENDLAAGAAIAAHGRSFVDLAVTGPTGTRRVLLLLH